MTMRFEWTVSRCLISIKAHTCSPSLFNAHSSHNVSGMAPALPFRQQSPGREGGGRLPGSDSTAVIVVCCHLEPALEMGNQAHLFTSFSTVKLPQPLHLRSGYSAVGAVTGLPPTSPAYHNSTSQSDLHLPDRRPTEQVVHIYRQSATCRSTNVSQKALTQEMPENRPDDDYLCR